ncbi:DNA helicase/exodeoxyribonuclease V subunit A [Rhodothalassium salexigens DSM 2132]|uniref:DNA 3'-5' helicase n=3 Tax=Rhodothalassium salexigens TaxID=1086 RepID=A0A4R2PLB4_RHOSA|nr:double-strand break repair helicase AddA [Rhodothalassium salexigens]MBB4210949.1 ATP-dependent helicase/nuclease subunit A [Rhodothalassium salexigens DSM 2132]TCP36393.1 DNA helicase/exodeoxyribonuclease V subunit A [Rhodothalassium salexigens DSM 2132]
MSALTPEQARAADPAASVFVSASAGTGKTHVLTTRLVRLLLAGTPPGRILCLTFTKAGAAEMKDRLYKELGQWTRLDDAGLAARLAKAVGAPPSPDEMARARRLFAEVIDLPGGFQVQTIHSFCQSLLGRFPLEAGMVPRFALMDDAEAEELRAAATQRVLESAGVDPLLAHALDHIATGESEFTFSGLIDSLLFERAALQRLFRTYADDRALAAALRRVTEADEVASETALIADGLARIGTADLTALAAIFARGAKTDQARGAALAAALGPADAGAAGDAGGDPAACLAALDAALLTSTGEPRKTLLSKGAAGARPDAEAIAERVCQGLLVLHDRLKRWRTQANSEALLRVGRAILAAYEADKARAGRVDYDDLIFNTEALLTRPGVAPWILYKLDGGIDHILIDEAQDTNPEQWGVVAALWAEFFAGDGAADRVRTVFAVGDEKQSIFGFQRADPEEFDRARCQVAQLARDGGYRYDQVPMDRSFRSVDAVLALVDRVFAGEAGVGLSHVDGVIRHRVHRAGQAGRVELWPLIPKPKAERAESWETPTDQRAGVDAEARLADRIARWVAEAVAGGDLLEGRGRTLRYGDVMVLVRRRTGFVDHLVRACRAHGVPMAGVDRFRLTEPLAVQDLMAAGRVALLADDDLTLAAFLKSPFVGLSEAALFDLAYDRGGESLAARLGARAGEPAFAEAAATVARLRARADALRPYEFFTALLAGDSGRRALRGRLGHEVDEAIDEFLARAQEDERRHPPSLEGFLHRLAATDTELKRESDAGRDEVRVLTVHGSKGLQAPVVFLPDTTAEPRADDRLLAVVPPAPGADVPLVVWPGRRDNEVGRVAERRAALAAKADLDYRRLLYVALTRAEDRLYVAGWQPRPGAEPGPTSWYARVRSALAGLDGVAETEDGRLVYRTVQRSPAPTAPPAAPAAAAAPPAPAWLHAPAPDEPAPSRPLMPSRPADEEPAAASPLDRAGEAVYRRGQLIHRCLELVPELPVAARAAAARAYLSQPAHGLDAATVDAWWAEIEAVLDDPAFAPLFGPGSRAEVAVAGVVDGQTIAGRVDRLAVLDRRVLVADFKTNRPPPTDPRDVPVAYRRQLMQYAAALARVFPDRRIEPVLVWTVGPRLMPLEPLEPAGSPDLFNLP